VALKSDAWRRQIQQRLALAPPEVDAKTVLLANVVGSLSAELTTRLAAPSRPAAVLLGLIERPKGLTILLTERAAHLPHHPGQISFPGGRIEAGDADPVAAALREAHEEVGLQMAQVEVLGQLSPQLTGTGFTVTPVVGWLTADFEARPDPTEVQTAFEVPLAHLLAPENYRRQTLTRWGTRFSTVEFYFDRHRIWGATAGILMRFIEIINV
jgi:8-oxo-dGTP pyrophosphatase MutT (NUDIX family)